MNNNILLSAPSSRSGSKYNLFSKTSSFENILHKKLDYHPGRYRNLLELFMNDGDPGINAFDSAFPGLWNDETVSNAAQGGDTFIIVSLMITQFLNILTSMGIKIFITFDDFQVMTSLLS